MNLIFQYSPWLIVLCLLVGIAYAFFLYRRDSRLKEFARIWITLLMILRFMSVSLLCFLLLSPLVKYMSREVAEPIIVIAEDQSSSMLQPSDSTAILSDFQERLKDLKSRLADNYRIEHYWFGEQLRKAEEQPSYNDRFTNFEELFTGLGSRLENRNVGAMLLVSDGIYNRGMNPLYINRGADFPIYTLAKGDTTQKLDLLISNVLHNKLAFLSNQFPIQVEYRALKAETRKAAIQIYHQGKMIDQKKLNFSTQDDFGSVEFLIEAKESGLQRYDIRMTPLEEERNLENNSRSVYIDVLDSRQKILLLYHAPHPDIAAWQRSISGNKNYEVEVKSWSEFDRETGPFDLVIFHQLIKRENSEVLAFTRNLRDQGKPIFFSVDAKSDWKLLNQLNLPLMVNNGSSNLNEVYPIYEEAFPLFKLNEEALTAIKTYPPLKVPQGNVQLKDRSYTLFRQQIGDVETQSPLLVFAENEGQKEGVLIGEGIWRWRMENYARFGNHRQFDELISKLIQYLSVKADKSYFRISHPKEVMENEAIRFDLQLFNKAYELLNEPEAKLVISNDEGKEFEYRFNRSSNAYYLEVSGLDVGDYSYRATTTYGQQEYLEKGTFSIEEIKVEYVQSVANHNLLFQLSEKSGGKMYNQLDPAVFLDELESREEITSVSYTSEEVEDIINLRWIFYVLIFLISLEWFIRKYQGAY